MKLIKIETYQDFANFKKPAAINVKESYLLPPYSTVIGAVHAMCGFSSYVDMDVSIQGTFETSVFDLGTNYEFSHDGKFENERRHQLSYMNGKRKCGITRGTALTENIISLKLTLHVLVKDETMFDKVLGGVKNPKMFPALGRADDIMKILKVSVVEGKIGTIIELPNYAYVPVDEKSEKAHSIFRLNKKYELLHLNKKKPPHRIWTETAMVMLVPDKTIVSAKVIDEDGCPVFLV